MSKVQSIELRLVGDVIGVDDLPKYATVGSAGVDLRAAITKSQTVAPGRLLPIPTGIAIHTSDSSIMAMLAARSGLACKHRIILANGVGIIDSDYQNEITVVIWNSGTESYTIQPKDRIAQLVFVSIHQVDFTVVNKFRKSSERGLGGFGHTGKQ